MCSYLSILTNMYLVDLEISLKWRSDMSCQKPDVILDTHNHLDILTSKHKAI